MAWNLEAARIDVFHRSSQHVPIIVTETSGQTWLLFGVYASIDCRERRNFYEEIIVLIDQCIPTIVAGDFNCVL